MTSIHTDGIVSLRRDAIDAPILNTLIEITIQADDDIQLNTANVLTVNITWQNQKPVYLQEDYFVRIEEHTLGVTHQMSVSFIKKANLSLYICL